VGEYLSLSVLTVFVFQECALIIMLQYMLILEVEKACVDIKGVLAVHCYQNRSV